jgi:hypothetical protein
MMPSCTLSSVSHAAIAAVLRLQLALGWVVACLVHDYLRPLVGRQELGPVGRWGLRHYAVVVGRVALC